MAHREPLDVNDADPARGGDARPDARRAHRAAPGAGQTTAGRGGRPAPARADRAQPGDQRPRRHAGGRHADHRHRERSDGIGGVDRCPTWSWPSSTPGRACRPRWPRGRSSPSSPPSPPARARGSGWPRSTASCSRAAVRSRSSPRSGHGTTVTVRCPALGGAQSGASAAASSRPTVASERILLVEDEAALRVGTARILLEQGYDVLVAVDGVEALEVFDRGARHDRPGGHRRRDAPDAGRRARPLLVGGAQTSPVIFMSGYAAGDAPLAGRLLPSRWPRTCCSSRSGRCSMADVRDGAGQRGHRRRPPDVRREPRSPAR